MGVYITPVHAIFGSRHVGVLRELPFLLPKHPKHHLLYITESVVSLSLLRSIEGESNTEYWDELSAPEIQSSGKGREAITEISYNCSFSVEPFVADGDRYMHELILCLQVAGIRHPVFTVFFMCKV